MKGLKIIRTEDNSHTLYHQELNETYHSFHGAIQESKHVFIAKGLEYFLSANSTHKAHIFEVGFGTGLNALLSYLYALNGKVELEYDTIEAYPLQKEVYEALNYPLELNDENAPHIFKEIHKCEWGRKVTLDKFFHLMKIHGKLDEWNDSGHYDVIFYDAFAPSKQPEMWSKELMAKMFEALRPNGVLVTYCAKGQLKRDLKEVGFRVETLDGPPGKKEMVRALKP